MNDETVKRYSLVEIVLLGIFILGLILAYWLVKVRHQIILSEPMALPGSGVSVPMPTNPGWQHDTNWRYESDSSMALVGQQQIRQSRTAAIRWRYAICGPALPAKDLLQLRAEQSGSRMGTIKALSGPVPMHYAIIYPQGSEYTFYLGVVPLDLGRYLELQVFVYQQLDLSYAENLLRSLAAGIQYELPKPLQAGHEMVDGFWKAIASGNLQLNKNEDADFLIKTPSNHPIGYYDNHISTVRSDSGTQWQLQSRYYEHQQTYIESTLLFDGGQNRFTWKSTHQKAGAGRPRHYTLDYENDGIVNIETDFEGSRQMPCSQPLLPEELLGEFAAMLLDEDTGRLTVDILSATGLVVPTILEKSDVQTASAKSDQIAFMVKADYLNNPYLSEELYYNQDKQLIGRLERIASGARLWEQASPEQLKQIFGDNFPLSDNAVIMQSSNQIFFCGK